MKQQEVLIKLYILLSQRFNEGELRTLCFFLEIDYDSLPEVGKENKARELISHLKRHDRVRDLVEAGRQFRPDIPWNTLDSLESKPEAYQSTPFQLLEHGTTANGKPECIFTIEQVDVLYTGQQINLDLQCLSRAYSRFLTLDFTIGLFNSYITLLYNYAIAEIGFCLYDSYSGFVYHEYRYKVLYGTNVVVDNPDGRPMGRGGRPIRKITHTTNKTVFAPWLIWSTHLLVRPKEEQQIILSGTNWMIPSEGYSFQPILASGKSFRPTYKNQNWEHLGLYARGAIGVQAMEYCA